MQHSLSVRYFVVRIIRPALLRALILPMLASNPTDPTVLNQIRERRRGLLRGLGFPGEGHPPLAAVLPAGGHRGDLQALQHHKSYEPKVPM